MEGEVGAGMEARLEHETGGIGREGGEGGAGVKIREKQRVGSCLEGQEG